MLIFIVNGCFNGSYRMSFRLGVLSLSHAFFKYLCPSGVASTCYPFRFSAD